MKNHAALSLNVTSLLTYCQLPNAFQLNLRLGHFALFAEMIYFCLMKYCWVVSLSDSLNNLNNYQVHVL